jgi:PIN domain nuclease of toxin-antitoxin system
MGSEQVILLDTHIWIWWVQGDERLSPAEKSLLDAYPAGQAVISAISFWEVALLITKKRLRVSCSLDEWIGRATAPSAICIQPISHTVAITACTLPGAFHNDPADRILVATANELGCPLVTRDARILEYSHANAITPSRISTETTSFNED